MSLINDKFDESIKKFNAMEKELEASMRMLVRNFWIEFPRKNLKSGIMLCIRNQGSTPYLVWRKFYMSRTCPKALWGQEYTKLTKEILKYRKVMIYKRFKEYDSAAIVLMKKRAQLISIRRNFMAAMTNITNAKIIIPTPKKIT